MYKLTITKTEPNQNYEEEMKSYLSPYGNKGDYPVKNFEIRKLEIELTDEEYKKVKAEVIKIWE